MNRAFYIIAVPAFIVSFLWMYYGWGLKFAVPVVGGELAAAIWGVIHLRRKAERLHENRTQASRADGRRIGNSTGSRSMFITEIFKSIQGESSYAGLPCVFVRLTGCNLRCTWCDTAYAFHGGTKYSVEEVMLRVEALQGRAVGQKDAKLIEITGGEPLLQSETPELARRLLDNGYTVLIETSGERDVSVLPREVVKIVDVKCPDSGESGKFQLANLEALDRKDEIKFVIASRRDYEFAREFAAEHKLADRVREVLFSPVFADPEGKWPAMGVRALAEWILEDGLRVRLGLQIHKFIWDPAMHGV